MKKIFLIILVLPFFVFAQIPAGYYNDAEGKTSATLKTALFNIVSDHVPRDYNDLWTDFRTTDARADGKVWDIYSNCNFTFGEDQDTGSQGNAECQKYNREHSIPNSWFGGERYTPMYSDLFHMYPTDKYVNAERSNFPYGETSNPTKTYTNGSKKGSGTPASGYTGTVFEPTDEFKGDLARTYFYMVTRYLDINFAQKVEGAVMFTYSATTCDLSEYSNELLLKWHRQDPVSEKEINRNNAIYQIQENRNPFIDYPELAEFIWGNKIGDKWYSVTQIPEIKFQFDISVHQNSLYVISDVSDLAYTIYNYTGQILQSGKLSNNKEISLNGLFSGIYIVKLNNGNLQYVDKFFVNANQW